MPRIISRALYQKLRELPELLEFQRDFELLSGLRLAFVDELGFGDDFASGSPELCAAIRESAAGRSMCGRSRHGLYAAAAGHAACVTCDAGLVEMAVPVRISGIPAGFFIFGGVAPQAQTLPTRHKAQHLLRKTGVEIQDADLNRLLDSSTVKPHDLLAAYQRIASLAANQIALKVTDQLGDMGGEMPLTVIKACGFIRAHSLVGDVSMALVARHCEVSVGHLSRLFHRSTGLTCHQYVAQVRAEHARALLLQSGKSVPEIALESGFRSLSQFHRVFRKTFGMAPGGMRRQREKIGTPRTG